MRNRATSRTLLYAAGSAAFIFAAIVSAPIRAQSSHGTAAIEGVVSGPDSKPVAGARVFLQPSDGRVPHVATTDSQGHYRFQKLRQDFYDVRAQLNGHSSEWTRNVNLRTGAQATVNLKLKSTPDAKPASASSQN
jgi:Carboxypeptidase regulatory-like domain